MDLSKKISEAVIREGIDLIGFAGRERFASLPAEKSPFSIFPEAKTVIMLGKRICRGSLRGVEEGTNFGDYALFGKNWLEDEFLSLACYGLVSAIEDEGWEAVPLFPNPTEQEPMGISVAPDRPAPDVNVHVRIAAMACGLGEIGWSKVFIHPVYGPRVRIGTILTDAVLEPDPLIEPGTLCKRCMKCVPDCPGNAVPRPKDRPSIKIHIEGKTYEWGDVCMGRCTATHHGINYKASPFMKRFFPGFNLDITKSNMSEELAYKTAYTLALGSWGRQNPEFPGSCVNPYYRQILAHTGYFAVCGAKGCIRACMEFQEKSGGIEQSKFNTPVFPGEKWELPPPEEDETGGIVEKKALQELYQEPDTDAGSWK